MLALPKRFLLALVLMTLSLSACNTTRPPATPSNFRAAVDDTPQVQLSWEAALGAVDYVLERKSGSGAYTLLSVVTSTSYTDESVQYNATYTYRLIARNNAATSAPAELSTTTPPPPLQPPDAPANLQAISSSTPQVVLRWTAPERVSRYILERQARNGSFETLSNTLPASTTQYTDTAVGSGTPYTYRLTAYNSAGSSSPVSVQVETPPYSEPGFTQTPSSYTFADDRPPGEDPGINPLTSPDQGLDVEYFDNPHLTGLFARRLETHINHSFSGQPPLPGMGPDTFSIRWIGLIKAPVSGTYTFSVLADDGVRLWVNDQLLISAWFDQNLTRRSASIQLSAGQAYRLKLEYYNQDARGAVKLRWAYPGQSEQVIPPEAFVRHEWARIGRFGPKLSWPTVATHAALLPDGRVMTFHSLDPVGKGQGENYRDYSKHGSSQVFVWTPGTPTDLQVSYDNHRTDLFCSGYVLSANGKLYLAGGNLGYDYAASGEEYGFAAGHTHTNIFDPLTNTWQAGPDMTQGRWYPSVINLPNEEMLIIGGNADQHNNDGVNNDWNFIPDVWDPSKNTLRRLTNASSFGKGIQHFYPWVHVAPNGQVFLSGSYKNWYYLDTSGAGAWVHINIQTYNYNRYYGSSVMYQPGKILVLGGGWKGFTGDLQGRETAQIIELNHSNQSISVRGTPSMAHPRTHLNATLMPDGRIFVNGGNQDGENFSNETAVYESEIWSPLTETFKRAAEAQCPRTYHSTALLLTDGSIITMGGGATGGNDDPNLPECDKNARDEEGRVKQKVNQLNAEIYYPPYLYNADGSEASRPVIQSAPSDLNYNQTFTLSTDIPASAVARVTLVALGAVTHAFNMGQRFDELNFSPSGPHTLSVTTPANARLDTPGFYMLHVLDGRGVPSQGKIVRLRCNPPGGCN